MFQFTYNSKSPSGSKPSVNGIPAITPSVTGEMESKADARPVSLCTTSIKRGSRWMPPTANS
jgi:hypothetical protein